MALEAIARVPGLAEKHPQAVAFLHEKLARHRAYVRDHGEDMPEILNWRWRGAGTAGR
ncbi:hypothetical protein AB4Z25_14230 [Rhizobium sp. RAF36]